MQLLHKHISPYFYPDENRDIPMILLYEREQAILDILTSEVRNFYHFLKHFKMIILISMSYLTISGEFKGSFWNRIQSGNAAMNVRVGKLYDWSSYDSIKKNAFIKNVMFYLKRSYPQLLYSLQQHQHWLHRYCKVTICSIKTGGSVEFWVAFA